LGNHRIVHVGRDLLELSGPIPLLKTCHLEVAAQDCAQSDFEYLHRWRVHRLSGKPIPVFAHPHINEFFIVFRWIFTIFNWCPLPLVLSAGTTEKRLAPHTSFPPNRYWYTLKSLPSTFSSPG